jgi:DNA-binding GntR family transcriptional regulator
MDMINAQPLHGVVADRLRDLIVQGDLAPGERLNERLLTERFGISRTPLREAIKMLSAQGLVKLLPNRGAVVTELTTEDAENMFQVMGVLEGLAGELASKRATDKEIAEVRDLHERMEQFYAEKDLTGYFQLNQLIHEKIVAAARNPELEMMHSSLSVRIRRARLMANYSRERWDRAMAEHMMIMDAFERRDGPWLRQILQRHLENKLDSLREKLI